MSIQKGKKFKVALLSVYNKQQDILGSIGYHTEKSLIDMIKILSKDKKNNRTMIISKI